METPQKTERKTAEEILSEVSIAKVKYESYTEMAVIAMKAYLSQEAAAKDLRIKQLEEKKSELELFVLMFKSTCEMFTSLPPKIRELQYMAEKLLEAENPKDEAAH